MKFTETKYISGCEFVLAALVIYFLIEEAIEIRSMGFEYLQSFWNCIDLAVIGVSLLMSKKVVIK